MSFRLKTHTHTLHYTHIAVSYKECSINFGGIGFLEEFFL